MTIRVGLRHVSRIIPVRLICPSGEQIIDGSFENNDPAWTWNASAQRSNAKARTGSWSAYFPNAPYGSTNYIEQSIPNVPVACITSFDLYYWKVSGGLGLCYWYVTIYYTDSTTDTGYFSTLTDPINWLHHDILPYCDPTKIINKLNILGYIINGAGYVDDVSLIC